ncbi:MAG: hypothetical protein ACTH4K_08790 [Serratia bockelmannii]
MRQFSIVVLVASLTGATAVIAAPMQAAPPAPTAVAPHVTHGPGPVINPENSQYMEEKNAAAKVTQKHQTKETKHHRKKTQRYAQKCHNKNRN